MNTFHLWYKCDDFAYDGNFKFNIYSVGALLTKLLNNTLFIEIDQLNHGGDDFTNFYNASQNTCFTTRYKS